MDVLPQSMVCGSSSLSWPTVTSGPTHTWSGSSMVTPSAMRLLVDAALHDLGDLCELHARVDAQQLGVVGGEQRGDGLAHLAVDAHHVGEVVLALGVVVADLVDVLGQAPPAEAVDARVALGERGLLLGGAVLVLDDGHHAAVGVALDAAVAGGVGGAHGEHRAGVVVCLGLFDQRTDGLGAHERRVAIEHDGRTLEVAQGVAHAHHGVPGTQALGLLDALDVGIVGKNGADFVSPVSHNDDDTVGACLASSVDRPPNQRLVEELMCDFGMTGLHTRTLAGCEDDRGN